MKQASFVPVPGSSVHFQTGDIPSYAARNVAQIIFKEIHDYFEDPEVKKDYEAWKARRYANMEGSSL